MQEYKDGNYVVTSLGDGRITYPTANGPKTVFAENPASVHPAYHEKIRARGGKPEDYFMMYSDVILRKAALPVIEHALAIQVEAKHQERAKEHSEFEAAKASGVAVRVIEFTSQYGIKLQWARRFAEEEKKNFAEWFANSGFYGFAADRGITVKRETETVRALANQQADGSFPGCENRAVIITEEQWNQILAEQSEAAEVAGSAKAKQKAELEATVVPENIMAVYQRYKGSAEKAWEAGDESAWALLQKWTPIIEAKGLGSFHAMRDLKAAQREEMAQYQGEA